MKILVTGGAGFIGSHIVDQLIENSYQVVVVDDLSTGKKSNINSSVNFYKVNIIAKELKDIFKKEKIDYVIHQAAQVSVTKSFKDPIQDVKINLIALLNLLNCCVEFNIKKIIVASSAAVYGEPRYLGIDENHPLNPLSPYGISKSIMKKYLALYLDLYGLKYTILRYANVYGPRQSSEGEGGVVAKFCQGFLNNTNPIIWGDGLQTRDFVFVKDVVKANIKALNKGDNQIINISTGQQTSILKLFNLIKEITAINLEPLFKEKRKGDIYHSYLLNDKAQKQLDWQVKWSLKRGLEETIKYYNQKLGKELI